MVKTCVKRTLKKETCLDIRTHTQCMRRSIRLVGNRKRFIIGFIGKKKLWNSGIKILVMFMQNSQNGNK